MNENFTNAMNNASNSQNFNVTAITDAALHEDDSVTSNAMKIVILVIACTGVVTNLIVVIVFLNDRKLRRKIPNICIINQVCIFLNFFFKLNNTKVPLIFSFLLKCFLLFRSYLKRMRSTKVFIPDRVHNSAQVCGVCKNYI